MNDIFKSENFKVMSLVLCGLLAGVGVTVLSAWASSEAAFQCYQRGGVVRLPMATTGNKGPVWQYFTNSFGRMYLMVDLDVTKEGPEFHRYNREPIVVLSENDLQRLESGLRAGSVRKKEPKIATLEASRIAH